MRLNNLVAKPFLLAAAFVLLAACHDDDKPEPEHEGEGQLIVTVENPGAQALALRIFGDGLTEPLESRFDAANATGKLDKWLPAGQYDALLTTDDPEAVTIDGTDGFATATATVRVPEGSTIMPALNSAAARPAARLASTKGAGSRQSSSHSSSLPRAVSWVTKCASYRSAARVISCNAK